MGDPLEIEAASRVFTDGRKTRDKLIVGSVKSNLGHTEATSGIAGIIKVVMALERAQIPPTAGIKTLNPVIDFEGNHFSVNMERVAWPATALRRASVNSFGYGGSNAHTILEYRLNLARNYCSADLYNEAPSSSAEPTLRTESQLFVFSAHTEASLKEYLASFFSSASRYRPEDLAHTLGTRRTHHRYRAYTTITGSTTPSSVSAAEITYGRRVKEKGLFFVFTGTNP